ncbi:MAG: tRNA1(Val) (adenine(37)-N6)-methyltransferase [Pseudomonadota bacterium]
MTEASAIGTLTTLDALLGGRVSFRQPRSGFRAAIDSVLLAAALPPATAGRALDLGCGAGAATLCLAWRLPGLSVVGLERDPVLADLARDNVARNGMVGRVEIVAGDVLAPPGIAACGFDAVICNPPWLEAERADPAPAAGRAAATVEGKARLAHWVAAALACARPKGSVAFIHRADRLADLLTALLPSRGERAGRIEVIPLWPKAGLPAKRVIVRARKGVAAPLSLSAGLVLHREDGRYTDHAEAILREGAGLDP